MKHASLLHFLCTVLTCVPPAVASAHVPNNILTIDAERIEHPHFTLHGMHVELAAHKQTSVQFKKLQWQDKSIDALKLECPVLQTSPDQINCPQGRLQLAQEPIIAVQANWSLTDGRAALTLSRDSARLNILRDAAKNDLQIQLEQLELAPFTSALKTLLPAGWQFGGTLNAHAHWQAQTGQLNAQLKLQKAQFSSADGLRAGEKLGFEIHVDLQRKPAPNNWQGRLRLDWKTGDIYLHPLYLRADSSIRSIELQGDSDLEHLNIKHANVDLHGVRTFNANARLRIQPLQLEKASAKLSHARLDLLGEHWLAPLLFSADPQNAQFSGQLDAELDLAEGHLTRLETALQNVSFSMPKQHFTIGPASGRIPWQPNARSNMSLAVDGGRWQKLNLGKFTLRGQSEAGKIRFDTITIPLLDSHIHFFDVSFTQDQHGIWHGQGASQIDAIKMKDLTQALDLPEMHGFLSANIPRIKANAGEIALDGVLAINVFDGNIIAQQLRIIEPFGTTARLLADLDAYQLNLFQLSQTFSFGSIQGLIDAHVHKLELVDWQPVAFDARILSSSGQYPKRISQRAVQNITALGGAGAMAALQRGILGFFEHFQYRRINMGCALKNNVCTLAGTADHHNKGIILIEGGGIPALNVIGYNRHVDWPEFLERLQRVTQDNQSPIIQ